MPEAFGHFRREVVVGSTFTTDTGNRKNKITEVVLLLRPPHLPRKRHPLGFTADKQSMMVAALGLPIPKLIMVMPLRWRCAWLYPAHEPLRYAIGKLLHIIVEVGQGRISLQRHPEVRCSGEANSRQSVLFVFMGRWFKRGPRSGIFVYFVG